MLDEGLIEQGITRIGAEQELCLVDSNFLPSTNNMEVLKQINDPHFVPEIARFNIEANLDPHELKDDCFDKMESELRYLLSKAHHATEKLNTKLVMTGILPTLTQKHLHFDYMTPNPRYKMLDDTIKAERGSNFEMRIMGVDDFIASHDNILFEACNTSFQVHMQIDPKEFTEKYNWAQMIAGPVLAVVANSPLLMGKRLWKETRIALFQQSVDTRTANNIKREQEPRVTFGKKWLEGTVVDLYKDNVSRFNPLITVDQKEDSMDLLKKGKIPQLESLKIHNGTVYKWNRACYGVGGGKPHLRIENRYIPAGPTVKDEVANAAFWLGLMHNQTEDFMDLPSKVNFSDVRYNFYNAARYGVDCQQKWMGKTVSASLLVRKVLLPLAEQGLRKANVNEQTIEDLLGIIERRVAKKRTGSVWILDNFNQMLENSTANEASRNITEAIYHQQMTSLPVHRWKDVQPQKGYSGKKYEYAKDIMETDLYIAREDDLVDLAINMMDWKNIRSIPVENAKHELVGLITARELLTYHTAHNDREEVLVSDVMTRDYVELGPDASTKEIINTLANTRACCILITEDKKLMGLVSESDIIQVAKHTGIYDR